MHRIAAGGPAKSGRRLPPTGAPLLAPALRPTLGPVARQFAPGALRLSPQDLALVLLSALLHAVWSVSIKGSASPLVFLYLQTIIGAVVGAGFLIWIGPTMPGRFGLLLVGAGVAHSLYKFWMSRAYSAADLSIAYPIIRSTPVVLPLFAIPLLGERISMLGAIGIVTVVAGMWVIQTGGRTGRVAWWGPGMGFAYLTLGTTVLYGLTDKEIMMLLDGLEWNRALPRSIFYFFVGEFGCLVLLTPMALGEVRRAGFARSVRGEGFAALRAVAISLASYSLILEALRTSQVSYVVAVRQSSVLFVLAMSVLWLGEKPGWVRVFGAATTVVGVALLSAAD
jgi:drug/metabolite transporter (DMT)-like permease